MSSLNLLRIFDSVFLVAMASWLGSLLFLSFGVAPKISQALPPDQASSLVRSLFRRCYTWGAISGAIALPAVVCGPLAVPELRGPVVGLRAGLILAGILAMFYCANVLIPALDAFHGAPPDQADRAERQENRLVVLNSLVMVVGVGLLVAHAYRRPPATSGIREPTPEERRLEYERHNRAMNETNRATMRRYMKDMNFDPSAPAPPAPASDK